MARANVQWCILSSHAWPSEARGTGSRAAASTHLQNSVVQACALLDAALHWSSTSVSCVALPDAPATPSSRPWQHHWFESPAASSTAGGHSNPVTPYQTPQTHRQHIFFTVESSMAHSSSSHGHAGPKGSGSKVQIAWRVSREAASKPGPVCPAAPLRPRPPIVLCPAAEMGLGQFVTNL
jgi:hypothetical protein